MSAHPDGPGTVSSADGDKEPSAAELIAELIREERMRADLPRSSGISMVISFDVKSA
jgi:hypothetical protein